MSSSIYRRLAVTNIKNNRKTYIPYILTAVLTVMMYYILDSLSRNPSIVNGNLKLILDYAVKVIVVFALIFLFYTNSFLIKRRKKEIGVYNILGMGKGHIARMLTIETMITTVVSIVAGLLAGLIFSKLMWLILLKIIHYDVRMNFGISEKSLINALVLFLVIFALILVYNLLQIKLVSPVELLHGSSQGEKEPKTKWLLAIFGIVSLGTGYYIAVTTESPLTAITMFFFAVICVILGTYALFVAGSVALLKILRKNKNFYYKAKHFTSVSGMIYRMKQNAVGLANICILSTMVLVMISTSVSLYVGVDDVLVTRFPQEFSIEKYVPTESEEQKMDAIIAEECKNNHVKIESELRYHCGEIDAMLEDGVFSLGDNEAMNICELYMIPLDDYNQMEDDNAFLSEDEVIIYSSQKEMYGKDTVQIHDKTYQVAKELETMKIEPKNESRVFDAYYIVFSDENQINTWLSQASRLSDMKEEWKQATMRIKYKLSFDLEGAKNDCDKAIQSIKTRIENEVGNVSCEGREMNRETFYNLYGGLLFIGIYLGAMFLMATVLIIYYKQISEGFDDKERYQIMQKVGMSKREVKSSIRSQVLTVFFLPLVVAIIHIAVAFKVITKLLALLSLVNIPLFLGCTIATVAVFAVFYAIVFAVTAKEYYKIVN